MKPISEMSKAECIDRIFELLRLGIPPKTIIGKHESKRRYYIRHKEEIATYNRENYSKNKPERQAGQKAYRERKKAERMGINEAKAV